MFQFFDAIAGFILTIEDFVANSIIQITNFLILLTKSYTFLVMVVGYFPSFLTGFFLLFISVSILFQVLNKGG